MRRRLIFAIAMALAIPRLADAFIFTDIVAQAQRVSIISQAIQQIQQLDNYRKEFDKYKKVFDGYYESFRRIYRRVSALDWGDFSPSNWGRLRDHLIRIWKTFDEGAWQAQVLALRISPLYSADPDYQEYVDKLVKLSEEQAVQLKKEEAHLIELQAQDAAHQEALARFKSRNASIIQGDEREGSEVALTQQIALTNAILIELASIQAESKVVEQRLLTQQKEARNLIMRMKQLEIEAQKGDLRNFDLLRERTRTR